MIKMYINNEEVVCDKNFEISQEMLSTSSTILNNCYPKSWEATHDYINNFYFPEDYSKCIIYNDNELVFCGVVKNTGEISLNPRDPKYCSLEILDYKDFLSTGETLDFVIENKTIEEAIEMVISAVSSYGIVKGNVNIADADEIIGAYNTQNKSAYDVFQYLAEISGSRWTTRLVDETQIAVDFYDPELMPRANNIEYTEEYFEDNSINNITFNYSTNDYRNKQVILSDKVYGSIDYVETIIANGYTRDFNTEADIGYVDRIEVNGVEVSFATKNDKELGIDADFYYEPDKSQISSNSDNAIYPAGTNITITYIPLIKGRQVVYNDNEVSRINTQTGRKGVVSRYEDRNDILSSEELLSVAQTYIKYKGVPEITLSVETYNNDLFNVGQIVYFDAPINNLKQDYMVKSKKININAIGDEEWQIFYTYELSSSFNSEKAINWFDNQRNKTTGNISTGETILRNIDIETIGNIIWQNCTITEISIDSDNVLNAPLNAPFIK